MDPAHSRIPARAGTRSASRPAVPPSVVLVEDHAWRRLVRRAEAVASRAAAAAGTGATVVLASDAEVKRLNARHRGRNKPTNVLTFMSEGAQAGPGSDGDIILALGTVRREAAAFGRSVTNHLAHLVVHGALHLHGHDHHGAGEARRMEMAETRILRRLGVPDPWRQV
jgi:probable rRNA maturation factor